MKEELNNYNSQSLINCPLCNNKLIFKEKEIEYIINDKKIKINSKGDYCEKCSDFFFSKKELKETEIIINRIINKG